MRDNNPFLRDIDQEQDQRASLDYSSGANNSVPSIVIEQDRFASDGAASAPPLPARSTSGSLSPRLPQRRSFESSHSTDQLEAQPAFPPRPTASSPSLTPSLPPRPNSRTSRRSSLPAIITTESPSPNFQMAEEQDQMDDLAPPPYTEIDPNPSPTPSPISPAASANSAEVNNYQRPSVPPPLPPSAPVRNNYQRPSIPAPNSNTTNNPQYYSIPQQHPQYHRPSAPPPPPPPAPNNQQYRPPPTPQRNTSRIYPGSARLSYGNANRG